MVAYFALWAIVLISLRTFEGFDASEALAALVILGVIFPALAMLATRRVSALPYVVHQPGIEAVVLMMYLVVIAWVLVSGFGRIARIGTEPLHSVVLLGVKLVALVGVPAAITLALGHYRFAELLPISLRWHDIRPALWMAMAALLMQSFLGRGLHNIREAHLPVWVLAVATPLSFAWLVIEVGVVEEFFFRSAAGATCGDVAIVVGRAGCGSRALWLATRTWFLLTPSGYAGSSWLTSFAIHGGRVLDRADLACWSFPRRSVDANEELRRRGYRARCR